MTRLGLLAPIVLLSSCSLDPYQGNRSAEVFLNFDTEKKILSELVDRNTLSPISMAGAPASVSSMHCFAVNVMGYDIGSSGGGDDVTSIVDNAIAGSSCAYPGITSQMLTGTGTKTFTVVVPTGETRIFQAVGVYDPDDEVCSSGGYLGDIAGEIEGDGTPDFYELDVAILDIAADETIDLSNRYDTASDTSALKMDCDSESSGAQCSSYSVDSSVNTTGDHDHTVNVGQQLGQEIVPSVDGTYRQLELQISASSSTRVNVRIETDSSDEPSGTLVDSNAEVMVPAANVPTTSNWVTVEFSSDISLNGGTSYWIVVEPMDNTLNSHWTTSSTHNLKYKNSGTWGSHQSETSGHRMYKCN